MDSKFDKLLDYLEKGLELLDDGELEAKDIELAISILQAAGALLPSRDKE